jgi:LacI family transcriptional regulator
LISTGSTGFVGVLVPVISDWYFSPIVAGAAEALYENELRPVISATQHEHAREVSFLDRLMHDRTDGALIILPEASSDELERLLDQGYRFVVIDPITPLGDRVPSVSVANVSGAEQAVRHLIALGHRRIAAITGPRGWVATEGRREGFHAALSAAAIAPEPGLEVEADFQLAPGAEAAGMLLDLPHPPTAIFAFNDNIAIGAIRAAYERGVRVPDDLSIVGFDDVSTAAVMIPGLTTVRQPLAELGRTAVRLLMRLERQTDGTVQIELPTRLVVRESTAPPPRS